MPSTHKKVVVRKLDRDSVNGYVAPNFIVDGKVELLNVAGTLISIDLKDIKGQSDRVDKELEGVKDRLDALAKARKGLKDDLNKAIEELRNRMAKADAGITARDLEELKDFINKLREQLKTAKATQDELSSQTDSTPDAKAAKGKQEDLEKQLENLLAKARKLLDSRKVVIAAPTYLARHGAPQRPADLAAHNCLRFNFRRAMDDWPFLSEDGQSVEAFEATGNSLWPDAGERKPAAGAAAA